MGPLAGLRVIELASMGPGPFCGMLLGDMGADVIRVDPPGADPMATLDPLRRNRRSIALNLKHADGVRTLLRLVERADACSGRQTRFRTRTGRAALRRLLCAGRESGGRGEIQGPGVSGP